MRHINGWRVMTLVFIVMAGLGLAEWQDNQYRSVQASLANDIIVRDLRDKEETLDLAVEFGFDPIIVAVTRNLAADAFRNSSKRAPTTWRFIRTERDLTYIILSIVQTESRGDCRAINIPNGPVSGIGLTQLVLSTARQYDKTVTQQELMTIPKNLSIAVKYFVDLLEKYNGNFTLAVLAWNRGPGTVDRLISLGQSPESNYARLVFTQAALRNASH